MKLIEFISKKNIYNAVETDSKKNLFKKISRILVTEDSNKTNLINEKLNERERLGSTGVGNGVAIPHAKIPGIDKTYLSIGICDSGIAFESIDSLNTKIFIMILHPEETGNHHLEILKLVSNLFIKKDIVAEFLAIKDSEEIIKYIKDNE